MSELKFDIHVNSSEFIEKTEQIRSAIRATSSEIEEQEKKIGLSFQQMADKAGLTANVMGNAIKEMHKQISDAIISLNKLDSENQERLANLRNKMGESLAKSEVGKSSDNGMRRGVLTQKDSAQSEFNSRENLSVDIEEQQKKLIELNKELLTYQKELEEAQSELSALRTEMTSVCEEMAQMRDAGQQSTEIYAELKNKSNGLAEAMEGTNEQLAKASDLNAGLEGVSSGLNGISGALSAATSMMELFSTENEFLQSVLQKVQTAIAITNGLQEVNTALGKESAFQLNVVGKLKLWWRAITLQAASAQGIETAAASAGTVVNLGLAGSFRAIGLAIKSIPVIGWILAGISALIGVYSLWTSSTEEQKEAQDEQNKSIKEFNEGIQNYAAKPVAMIELLSAKFKALGNDVDAQKKFVTDHKKAFDELGVSINNVKDAQQLLIDNKQKFVDAQIAKAISLVYVDKMQEEAKNYVEAKDTADTWKRVGEKRDKESMVVVDGIPVRKGKQPANTEEYKMLKAQGMLSEDGNILRDDETRKRDYSNKADASYKKMMHYGQLSLAQSQKSENLMNGFGQQKNTSNPKKTDNTKQIEEANEREMKLIAQNKSDQERFVKDSQNRITQAEIDALADGAEKTFKQLELNQKKEEQSLERERGVNKAKNGRS